jgi:ribosome-associated translation inhibitor RaiA
MVVIKKLVGNYTRKLSDGRPVNNLTITLKPIHKTDKDSVKYELKSKLDLDGKIYNSEIVEYNLFIGIDSILKKLEAQIR